MNDDTTTPLPGEGDGVDAAPETDSGFGGGATEEAGDDTVTPRPEEGGVADDAGM